MWLVGLKYLNSIGNLNDSFEHTMLFLRSSHEAIPLSLMIHFPTELCAATRANDPTSKTSSRSPSIKRVGGVLLPPGVFVRSEKLEVGCCARDINHSWQLDQHDAPTKNSSLLELCWRYSAGLLE